MPEGTGKYKNIFATGGWDEEGKQEGNRQAEPPKGKINALGCRCPPV